MAVCPVKKVEVKENKLGFLEPLNSSECKHSGTCQDRAPALTPMVGIVYRSVFESLHVENIPNQFMSWTAALFLNLHTRLITSSFLIGILLLIFI